MPSPATAGPPSVQPSSTVTATPTPAVSAAPTDDSQPIPTSTATGWWGEDGVSFCSVPAHYRLDGKAGALGPCLGVFFDPPNAILTLAVGQDLDIHMSVVGQPYTLPTSSDPLVIRAWLITDTATMTYRALSPGTARLMTTGPCLIVDRSPTGAHEVNGPCPVVEVHVGKIPTTDCTTVPVDLCHAAAAEAVLFGFPPDDPGQHLVGWKAIPGSGDDWPGCGREVVDVMLTLRNPDRVATVYIGQFEPDSLDPRNLAVCTF